MAFESNFAWAALLFLGAAHGVNPAMGWLFAVSLGLQEERRSAVWRALGPLALGHAAAILAAVAAAVVLGQVFPLSALKGLVAVLLVGFGVAHLTRHRHPGRGGMRVGPRDLTLWSFLTASAHGAGLMALPFFLSAGEAGGAGNPETTGHAAHHATPMAAGMAPEWITGLLGGAMHTGGYLLMTGLLAVAVYEWMGLSLLRRAWINLDLIWSGALVATGVATLLL